MAQQDISRTHSDYTVAWVCALPKEQTAATTMLDEIHPELSQPPNDHNTYTLGSVHNHNVVIACLPKGRYGTNAAATVGTRMLGTFPSIKFGLMVGIGGGIPPNVRLGDVVVSTPVLQYPGVVQWDLGKAGQGGKLERTGALDNPPGALLTALAKLETRHELVGPKIPDYLNELKQKYPNVAPEYLRSDSLKDPLFAPKNSYRNRNVLQVIFSMLWHAILVLLGYSLWARTFNSTDREAERRTSTRKLQVHYGLIASGNQVIKDAGFRDRLNESLGGNLLCVEMEAAGLMHDFPCIVVRDICDYADSHKNKEWQKHAAAVAAAFAKELLSVVPTQAVEDMPAIKRVEKRLDEIAHNVNETRRSQEHQAILEWLTPVDYASQQHSCFSRRQPGTGQWLLRSPEFQTWLEASEKSLLCHGLPGVGKTFLASIIIDYLQTADWRTGRSPAGQQLEVEDDKTGVAYAYCEFAKQDQHKTVDILASLVKQLIQRLPHVPETVKNFYAKHKNTLSSSHSNYETKLFSELLQCVIAGNYSRVFIVVDALDECQHSKTLVAELLAVQKATRANFLATSRPGQDIDRQFVEALSIEVHATDEDLEKYIDGRMWDLDVLKEENEDLTMETKMRIKTNIKNKIVQSVDGIFLLARFHLDSLVDKTTPNEIFAELETLPRGPKAYEQAYGKTIRRIRSQQLGLQRLAQRVLLFLTYARRPLTALELRHALAVKIRTTALDENDLQSTTMIVAVCMGLVIVEEESSIIRLLHHTTQEYLRTNADCLSSSEEPMTLEPTIFDADESASVRDAAEREITAVCVTYLSFSAFDKGPSQSGEELNEILELHPFYDYAAGNWGYHARKDPNLSRDVMEFLECKATIHASIQASIPQYQDHTVCEISPDGLTKLHLAAYYGLSKVVEELLRRRCDMDAKDPLGRTPFSYAAQEGHEAVAKLMLETGQVNCNSEDCNKRTPLSWAAERGHHATVKLLLAKDGVNPNHVDVDFQTPLRRAAAQGHGTVVRLLLEDLRVDPDSRDTIGWTPLLLAAITGHDAVARLLLTTGRVDVNAADSHYKLTPLQWATLNGHEKVVRLLLASMKVEVNPSTSWPPPTSAAQRGDGESTRLSVASRKAKVNNQDDKGETAFPLVAGIGNAAVVNMLPAAKEVDVNCKDVFGRTPLLTAVGKGHRSIVESLLDAEKIELDVKSDNGSTALSLAVRNLDETIVRLLLDKGADIESRDRHGSSPLSNAASSGREGSVKLLLERGANIHSKDNYGQTPLSLADKKGFESTVRLLQSYQFQ